MSRIEEAADDRLMGLAIALGRRNLGRTWPNPSVGCVLVDGAGRILAEGATHPGGRPHAEVVALSEAGDAARGGTLYVSLEPCSHHGRTPPCADAIVAAGVARVVTAVGDPNPLVAGEGHARLRAAGIAVVERVREPQAREAHRGHLARMAKGRPFVTLKLARTADGFAGEPGRRFLITGAAFKARTHMLRAQADAILVGSGTVLADDPRLDVRLPGMEARSPLRVGLDSQLATPPDAVLVRTARERPTWIVTGDDRLRTARADALREAGVELVPVLLRGDGRLRPADALGELARRGLTSVFCEGGPTLAAALAEADLLDEIVLATAPIHLDEPGIPAVGPALQRRLANGFVLVRGEVCGPDRLEWYRRADACSPAW